MTACRLNTDTGELTMEQGVPKGEHLFTVKVTDSGGNEVISTVIVNVIYLEEEQVMSSGSMRLSGECHIITKIVTFFPK